MKRSMIHAACAVLLAMSAFAGRAEAGSFVLRVGKIYPVSPYLPPVIEDGVIVVRDGVITQVGDEVALPPDLPVYEYPDAVAIPGLVSAANSILENHAGDESIGAGYMAIDAYLPYGDYDPILASGVTTVHLSPGAHRLVAGQGAVVRLGGPMGGRVLLERSDAVLNLGEGAQDPPNLVEYQTQASSDVAIPAPVRQRPTTRVGQLLALEEMVEGIRGQGRPASWHDLLLRTHWRRNLPWRVQADRAPDMMGGLAFAARFRRDIYMVGGSEALAVLSELRDADVPLVYRASTPLREVADDLGRDPDVMEPDLSDVTQLHRAGIKLALSTGPGAPASDLRMVGAMAMGAGLGEAEVLEALTRTPARILGVDDRVGSLQKGRRADIVLMSGRPLAPTSHVRRVFIDGETAFDAPKTETLVVRAGRIWVDEETMIRDGAVLIEKGRVAAVGRQVPHPPFARFIDAGRDAFVAPGMIDAVGHLGLHGDKSIPGPAISLSRLVGVADVDEVRVARAGVTTVMLSPYGMSPLGSQVSAVKTAGRKRDARVVRDTGAVAFNFERSDPADVKEKLDKRLKAGKAYRDKWLKYEKELAEWKEKKAKGEATEGEKNVTEKEQAAPEVDPVTGTWTVTVSGDAIPEPATGKMRLRLDGSQIEGRMMISGAPEDVRFVGTLEGNHISGQIELDTGGMGYPQVEADIVEEDHIVGKISFQGIDLELDATRIDKSAVEFRVVRRRTRGKDGRPLPPKTEPDLEPLRAVLDGRIPLVVSVRTAAQIEAVMALAESYEAPLVLEGAEDAGVLHERIKEKGVGVIVPREITRWKNWSTYHQADDLARRGVPVAFQSRAEDGARSLARLALHAVERGMSPDAALAALTTQAARLYKLEDEIGSLRVGCQGDMVIFDGHPFETGSSVRRVVIGGEVIR